MKRIFALLLALALIFSLAACGTETVVIDNTGSSDTESTEDNTPADTDKDASSSQKEETDKPASSSSKKPASNEEHTHNYTAKLTPATCTKGGYTTFTCACGDSYKANETPASHNYSGYVCKNCGAANKEASLKFLDDIVEANGTDGTAMTVEFTTNNGDGVTIVREYDTTISIKKSGFKGSEKFECSINLTKETFKVSLGSKSANGKIKFDEFTKTTKVEAKADFVDAASEIIHSMLGSTISDFKASNINLALADFGFKVY